MKNIFKKICDCVYWGVSACGKFWVCTGCGKKRERDIEKEIQEIYR